MRTTEYFERKIADRNIRHEWCEWVVENHVATEVQEDHRIRYWAYVAEAGHYIRVVTESDGTFLNASFDRAFGRRRER